MFSSPAYDEGKAVGALVRRVDAALCGLAAEDRTAWDDLIAPSDAAHAEFLASQPPHVRTLLRVDALLRAGERPCGRGPAYPFVFGDLRTNGLLTAARWSLDNVAVALYISGSSPGVCAAGVVPGSRVGALLGVLSELDTCVLTSDAGRHYDAYVAAAAHAADSGVAAISAAATSLVGMAYLKRAMCGPQKLSPGLSDVLASACATGESSDRVGRLALRFVSLQIDAAARKARADAKARRGAPGAERLAVADRLALLDVPGDLPFE